MESEDIRSMLGGYPCIHGGSSSVIRMTIVQTIGLSSRPPVCSAVSSRGACTRTDPKV